jgi:Alpha amylase, catalytic domain
MKRLVILLAAGIALWLNHAGAQGLPLPTATEAVPNRLEMPNWSERRSWEDEIVYVIVVSKFFDGDPTNNVMLRRFGKDRSRYEGGFWGGDLEGVIQKLDYLTSLGVTTLLLYPVMDNDDGPFGKYLATGYRSKDYLRVDENFGDMATLRRLVERAHQRGLRVILDLPLGMPGVEHPFQTDPQKQSWFGKVTPYGVRQWDAGNPQVADYLVEVARFWREQSRCDGFRLDSAQLHSTLFWRRFTVALRGEAARDDFVLLAEVPLHPSKIGEFLIQTGFNGAYDFSFGIVRDVLGRGEPLAKLSFVLGEGKRFYPHPGRMVAQIDNYEDPAFVTAAPVPKRPRTDLAMALLLTCDRIPLINSGDEEALDYREVGGLFVGGGPSPRDLAWVKTLIALRKRSAALRRGVFTEIAMPGSVYAFLQSYGTETVLVMLNTSGGRQEVSFGIGRGRPWRDLGLHDLIGDREVKPQGSPVPLGIEPFGVRILQVD